ncbi:hypothetical protein J4470_02295 [Candidatus Woesearchaeota archaeon]|nr:hypothetical protein [Candidatus Woesearchaeota archaeon]
MRPETILGLTGLETYSGHSHDSSACMADEARIVGAVSEGRFTRNRHHAGFPWMGVKYLLSLGYSYSDIDAVAIPWPLKEYSKRLKIVKNLYSMIPVFKARMYSNQYLPVEKKKIIGIGHQRAHAASAYRTSGFKKALVVSLDLGGPEEDVANAGGGIFVGDNGELTRIKALTASFGVFYAFVTEGLGFRAVDDEGKITGLAPYGDSNSNAYSILKDYAPTVNGLNLVKQKKGLRIDFSVVNNHQRFVFNNLGVIGSLVKRFSDKDVAAAAQRILEEGVVELVENALEDTGMDRLCLAGGIFLNVKLNKRLRELKRVKGVYVSPNPGDAGTAVGAALEAHHNLTGEKIPKAENNVYLGPEYTDAEIEAVLKKHKGLNFRKTSEPSGDAAELISKGRIVGWFQGRMEWAPHSLGARSVLSSPQEIKIKEKINFCLKQRDRSTPYSPSILLEEAYRYLKKPSESPYMNMAYDVLPHAKDEIAAAVHVDNTVRAHTVKKQLNPLYYDLIREHEKMTGVPAVLNTSFSRQDQPIVCSPEDAVNYLLMKCVEDLVIGNFVVNLK